MSRVIPVSQSNNYVKHTDRYLHGLCFRWNRRKENTESRLADVFAGHAARLRWKELVA